MAPPCRRAFFARSSCVDWQLFPLGNRRFWHRRRQVMAHVPCDTRPSNRDPQRTSTHRACRTAHQLRCDKPNRHPRRRVRYRRQRWVDRMRVAQMRSLSSIVASERCTLDHPSLENQSCQKFPHASVRHQVLHLSLLDRLQL